MPFFLLLSCRQRFFAGRGDSCGGLVWLVVFDVGADSSYAHVLDNDMMYDVCHVKYISLLIIVV